MKWNERELQSRLRIIGFSLLIVGLVSAAIIYIVADRSAEDAVGYDMVNGQNYAVSPQSSKRYVHDLEVYGGKAAVLADDIDRWFFGLWQGTELAYTVAFLATITALGFFLVASQAGRHREEGGGDSGGNGGQP